MNKNLEYFICTEFEKQISNFDDVIYSEKENYDFSEKEYNDLKDICYGVGFNNDGLTTLKYINDLVNTINNKSKLISIYILYDQIIDLLLDDENIIEIDMYISIKK